MNQEEFVHLVTKVCGDEEYCPICESRLKKNAAEIKRVIEKSGYDHIWAGDWDDAVTWTHVISVEVEADAQS